MKQPYHAAEGLEAGAAEARVIEGREAAHRWARQELEAAARRCHAAEQTVEACAVLVPKPPPPWSTAEILAVHIRMHQAEGALFPEALCRGAEACGLRLCAIPMKELEVEAARKMEAPQEALRRLGAGLGPPWGKDQKAAALAAMIALLPPSARH